MTTLAVFPESSSRNLKIWQFQSENMHSLKTHYAQASVVLFSTPVKPNFITAVTKLQEYFKTSSASPTQKKKQKTRDKQRRGLGSPWEPIQRAQPKR